MTDGPHFISEASAVVGGYTALVIGSALRGLARQGAFDRLAPHQRAEVLRVVGSIEHAGGMWRSSRGAANGPVAPVLPPGAAPFLTCEEVADVLGLQPRQVRKLAASGLGQRLGGRWVFDRAAVLAEAQRREAA